MDFFKDIDTQLFEWVQLGPDDKDDKVREFISSGASPQWTTCYGYSVLHQAAYTGLVSVARLLLDNGWELDLATNEGDTPLHLAAFWGEVDMLQFLADRGALINPQNTSLETPLHNAAKEGGSAAARLLLNLGADRSVENDKGKTAEELCKDEETRAVFDS